MQTDHQVQHTQQLLNEVATYPLLSALFGRRARRFGLGMSIPDGPLAYTSQHEPVPLNDLERALLVLCATGVSGWHFGIEQSASGDPEKGCNYPIRLTGRTSPSSAGMEASELIFTDDSGTYITQLRDLDPERQRPLSQLSDLETLTSTVMQQCAQILPGRVQLPAQEPYIEAHNIWNANKPGTTVFAPVIDLAQMTLDIIFIYLMNKIVLFDPQQNRLCGNLQPFIKSGLLDENRRASLFDMERNTFASASSEMAIIGHNIVLMLQAMGLGGWLFTGISANSFLGAYADDGVPGAGFLFSRDSTWTQPNPVGLDRLFEGHCPPYHQDMRAAVAHLVSLKFGPHGTFDPQRPGPFRENATVKAAVERYSPAMIECAGEIAQYIYDTYGKFPATTPSIYCNIFVQAQHIDTDFYDQLYSPDAYLDTHRQHLEKWHRQEQ